MTFLIIFTLFAQGLIVNPYRFAGGASPTYLIKQGFETATTGYDNGETWTEAGTGVIDHADTDSPSPLVGTQSLRITLAGTQETTFSAFAAQSTAYGFMALNRVANSSTVTLATFRSGASVRCTVSMTGSGAIRIAAAGTAVAVVDTVAVGETVYIWWRYTLGSGLDAVGEVWTSATETKPPSSGDNYAVQAGTATTTVDRIYIGDTTNQTDEFVYDKVRVDDVAIGSNPQ